MILREGILHSTLLEDVPVVHGFTTRKWGNLGYGKNPQDPEVSSNRRALFDELRLNDRIHIQPRQVHSARCVNAIEFVPGMEADATFGNTGAHLFSVLTADCIPILLYHPEGVVGAVHAGWRGLYNGILEKSLERLPAHPIAVLGPAIGACCYEVDQPLAADFVNRFGAEVIVVGPAKPRIDLVRVAVVQLQRAGVDEIEAAHLCTACHPDLFFSYRRDGSSGRMMAFIGLV